MSVAGLLQFAAGFRLLMFVLSQGRRWGERKSAARSLGAGGSPGTAARLSRWGEPAWSTLTNMADSAEPAGPQKARHQSTCGRFARVRDPVDLLGR